MRQPQAYAKGHIPGATLIPVEKLENKINRLPENGEIVCVCENGRYSKQITRQLSEMGYNAVAIRGGMKAWQRKGLPLKRGKGK